MTTTLMVLGAITVLAFGQIAEAQGQKKIRELKNLYIDTELVVCGKPEAVIVAPEGEQYSDIGSDMLCLT